MSLSDTEEIRILRALYRFELCCNIFGNGIPTPHYLPRRFEAVDILKNFICLYEPWEVEEIVCINAFAKDLYDLVFMEIAWDLHPDNSRFAEQRRPPTPEGAFDLESQCKFSLIA
jgi:hypothetical protein